jgi:hypothetical protein
MEALVRAREAEEAPTPGERFVLPTRLNLAICRNDGGGGNRPDSRRRRTACTSPIRSWGRGRLTRVLLSLGTSNSGHANPRARRARLPERQESESGAAWAKPTPPPRSGAAGEWRRRDGIARKSAPGSDARTRLLPSCDPPGSHHDPTANRTARSNSGSPRAMAARRSHERPKNWRNTSVKTALR